MPRRSFLSLLKLLPALFFFNSPAPKPKPAPIQGGLVGGLFDEHGVTRLPVSYNFLTLPLLVASPTGGYFTVSKFEAVALTEKEGAISAQGEPGSPCAFTWIAFG